MRAAGPDAFPHHRPNAGVVLFAETGLCWIGKRSGAPGPWVWQWPQGGVDPGEDAQAAALRELYEETGATAEMVTPLGSIEDWLAYDFPPEVRGGEDRWRGQKQRWFAYRFHGRDADFDLTAVPPQEFESFRWERLERVPELIIPWKREVYAAVAEAFAPFAR